MSTITVDAAAVDTAIATLASTVATLITDCAAAESTFRALAGNSGREQAGLSNIPTLVRNKILSTPQLAIIMREQAVAPAGPALATQLAAF